MPAPNRPPSQQRKGGKVQLRRRHERQQERQQRREAERAAERAEGKARKAYKPKPITPTAPTTATPPTPPPAYGPLMQRAQRDAQMLYGDQILRAQAAQQNAGSFFETYKADVAKAQQAVAARYATAQQSVAPPTVGPVVQGADEAAAAASRGVMDKAFSNLLTSQGAAQQDYFTGRQTVGSAQQLQSRTQAGAEVNRLASERDKFALGRRDEYRDQAHTKRLEKKAFGLDVAKAGADAADKAADNQRQAREDRQQRRDDRRERREAGGEVNQYGYSKREWQRMTTGERQAAIKTFKKNTTLPSTSGGKEGGAKFTPSQTRDARKAIRTAVTLVKSKPAYSDDYYPKARDALVTEKDMDPVIAKAAVQLVRDGSVSAAVAKALWRDYGIRVKPRGKTRKITPTQQPNQNFAPGANGQVRPN